MPRTYDFVVIGLGAMGAATLSQLSRVGRAIGLERVLPGHAGGSSWGESRMIRLSNFENPGYAPLVRRSVELWETLERGRAPIFLRCGVLEAGPREGELMTGTLAAAAAGGFQGEVLTAAQTRARFPAVTIPDAWIAAFQPGAGLLRADRAIRAFIDDARAAGAEVRLTGVRELRAGAGGVVAVLDDGEEIQAGAAVVTAGSEIAALVPALRPAVRVRPQIVGWFAPGRPELVGPDRLPAFCFDHPEGFLYGFPDFAGTGLKAAFHRFDDAPAEPAAEVERVRRTLQAVLGPFGPAHQVGTCPYTITPDEEFVIDTDPDRPGVWFASACSGHGFKFAPAIGEMLTQLAMGQSPTLDPTPFRLGRFR